jgi:L-amino acid N-acyltransferase YncA
MHELSIRLAVASDLPAINAIYNHYVIHSTCTYQTEPSTAEERSAWFNAHGPGYPVTVVEDDGEVIGWGSLSRFHMRAAYRPTVENSVYIRHDRLARGVGRLVLQDLIRRAEAQGYHSILAGISADQEPSVKLHARLGFVKVAHLREVGRKFEQWLDVVYMQKML